MNGRHSQSERDRAQGAVGQEGEKERRREGGKLG